MKVSIVVLMRVILAWTIVWAVALRGAMRVFDGRHRVGTAH